MRNADLEKLATDARLKPDTVRVILFVAARGTGSHPIPTDEFAIVLEHGGVKRVRAALHSAVRDGWITKAKGGWGSPDLYEFTPPSVCAPGGHTVEDPDRSPQGVTADPTVCAPVDHTEADSQVETPEETPVYPPGDHTESPVRSPGDHTTRARALVVGERSSSTQDPPIVPPGPNPLDGRVQNELRTDHWNGCRSAIRDYFSERVETGRQHGYLRTIQTWIEHGTGPKGFASLDVSERRALIATGMNELLSESEKDERLYRSSQGRLGNVRVLQTKLEIAVKRHHQRPPPKPQGELPLSSGEKLDPYGRVVKPMDE